MKLSSDSFAGPVLICIVGATCATGSFAQQAGPVLVDIAPCLGIESVLERLDCYDALARAADSETPAQSEPRGNADPAGSAAKTPTDAAGAAARFGLPREPEPERERRRRDEIDEITSEVAALREIVPGQLEITLTNGQVWRQTNSDRYRLQVGHPVRVYPTRFGQYYRLTSEVLRGFVQVERVR